MTFGVFVRQLGRETRGARGRLAFFTLCLAIGVGGVTAVAGFSNALRSGLRTEARRLLAADVRIEARKPLPAATLSLLADRPGLRITTIREMPTVALVLEGPASAGRSQLVELRAIDGEFPFYGKLQTEPDGPLEQLLSAAGALAGAELFEKLNLEPGDPISIGGKRFTLRGRLESEPDRIGGAFALGPRLYVAGPEIDATSLLDLGSRVQHSTLIALAPEAGMEAAAELAAALRNSLSDPTFYRVETFADGQPELRRAIDRTERFLGLTALLSLLVGGIGIAQTVRAWLASRLDSIAVFEALGGRPREIAALFAAQIGLLALTGSALGALLGLAATRALPIMVTSFLPDLPPPELQFLAVARGLALGTGVALLFAAGPVISALRVPALRVLRRDAEPIPTPFPVRALLAVTLFGGTAAIAALQAHSWRIGLAFAGGLALTAAALALAARLLAVGAARVPRLRLPTALRWSLAALARPGTGASSNVVALGLGSLVLVGMASVEANLQRRLAAELPQDAPSAFLIDIQSSQWPGVQEAIAAEGASRVDSVPLVMARIGSIDGTPVRQLTDGEERDRRRWALTREQRLTWLEQLPEDNEIVDGALWSDPEIAELSVEEEYAQRLGLAIGSRITFDLQGVPLELTVTSLRRVRWESFGINFFWVVEPGVLDQVPQMRIAAVRLPPGGENRLRDALAARYPNVTLFAIRDVLEKVIAVLGKISIGIRFLGLFTISAAVAILAGAVAAGAARRAREVAVGKALGMTRAQVVVLFATEYALTGAAGGLVGALAGSALSAAVVERGFEMPWRFEPALVAGAIALTAGLAVAAGLAASARALAERPIEALRHEG